jgi:hypothetical protein
MLGDIIKYTTFLLMASLILSSCSGFNQSPASTITSTANLPSPTETATINWFPATSTRTPFPTRAANPTREILPGLGALIFFDNFNQADLWNLSVSKAGSSIIDNNLLTLTLSEGTDLLTIISLRKEPVLGDFYAEITAHLSLCRGRDQYSLLFRLISALDFYRYSAACTGEVRLERVVAGKPFVIIDWTPSPDAPTGAPGEVKMGVWAAGRDLRFFLNDHFIFNVSDYTFAQGGLGFSIRSDLQNPMTASFSNLSVYALLPGTSTPSPADILAATPTRTPVH